MKYLLTKNGKLVPENHIALHPRRKRSLHVIRALPPLHYTGVFLSLVFILLSALVLFYVWYMDQPLLNPMGKTLVPVVHAQEAPQKTPIAYIKQFAYLYGVNENLALCIAKNESGFNPEAVGDNSLAVGIFQWHLSSWKIMRKKMGLSQADERTDVIESTKTAMFAISQGYGNWWTPFRKGICK